MKLLFVYSQKWSVRVVIVIFATAVKPATMDTVGVVLVVEVFHVGAVRVVTTCLVNAVGRVTVTLVQKQEAVSIGRAVGRRQSMLKYCVLPNYCVVVVAC